MLQLLLFGGHVDFDAPLVQGGGDRAPPFALRAPIHRFQDSHQDVVKRLLHTGTNRLRCHRLGFLSSAGSYQAGRVPNKGQQASEALRTRLPSTAGILSLH